MIVRVILIFLQFRQGGFAFQRALCGQWRSHHHAGGTFSAIRDLAAPPFLNLSNSASIGLLDFGRTRTIFVRSARFLPRRRRNPDLTKGFIAPLAHLRFGRFGVLRIQSTIASRPTGFAMGGCRSSGDSGASPES